MKVKQYILTIIYTALSAVLSAQTNSYSVTDDFNRKIDFQNIPQRVISLAPSLTEFIYLLDCEDKLVGNTTWCNYPKEANDIMKVGDMLTFNYETILSLKPDLLFITVEGNTKGSFDKLNELGLKTFILNPRNYNDIKNSLTKIAEVFQKTESARRIISSWDLKVDSVKKDNEEHDNYSVMIIVDLNPLFVAGENTFLNEYLQYTNLTNFASDSPLNYPVYSREEILKRNPDYIIYPSGGSEDESFLLEAYPEWNELEAFQNNHVIFVDRDMYFRPGPRFVKSLEDLSYKLLK